jgi:cupin 2 domain-containing protein
MNKDEGNIFIIPGNLPKNFELFQSILSNGNLSIERIISTGQKTPENQWLEQDKNEWVILLQGETEIMFKGEKSKILTAGDYVHIPENTKHKIIKTSTEPVCIWLAVHY